jgi:hypothetical protein
MRFKVRLLNKSILTGLAIWVVCLTGVFGQSASTPPVPIWPGNGNIPKSYSDRKVFLSPDEHSVVLLWPNQDGTGSKPVKMPLHNAICPDLRVRIEKSSNAFVYTYSLENKKESEDSITTFSIVVHPDADMQVGAEFWTGGKSTAIVGNQVALPGTRSGGLAIWFCPEGQPLPPGRGTSFTLAAGARPGFTTAATEHFPHLDLTDEWPQQILDELEPVLTPSWIDQHVITLGPRYSSAEPAANIAADYAVGVKELTRKGVLDQNSSFVRELTAILEGISSGKSPALLPPIEAEPHSPAEAEILNGLQLSLDIRNELK